MKIKIKIAPNAKTTEIVGWEHDILKIRIKSPPVEGKANKELIAVLSKALKTPKNTIEILNGKTGKLKTVLIPDDIDLKSLPSKT